jgi:hypothetical protein
MLLWCRKETARGNFHVYGYASHHKDRSEQSDPGQIERKGEQPSIRELRTGIKHKGRSQKVCTVSNILVTDWNFAPESSEFVVLHKTYHSTRTQHKAADVSPRNLPPAFVLVGLPKKTPRWVTVSLRSEGEGSGPFSERTDMRLAVKIWSPVRANPYKYRSMKTMENAYQYGLLPK